MPAISISKGNGSAKPADAKTNNEMAEKDLESIGRHCQYEYCGQLDFLPFHCGSCKKTYCLEHRSEVAHTCPRAGAFARERDGLSSASSNTPTQRPNVFNSDQCTHVSCKTLINTTTSPAITCPGCNHQYCLKHRLREEHDCAKITPRGARQGSSGSSSNGTNANDTIRSMFARVRTWGKDATQSTADTLTPKPKPKANSPAARSLSLNNMKRSAKGDPGVPMDRRTYLHVVGTSTTQSKDPPAGDFWFDAKWKVGRVLDDAAKRLRVENLNNRVGEEGRLRFFHVESGEFLEFSESISEGRVKPGDTLVMLRGAGVMLGK